MSINQFSPDTTQATTLWWTQQPGGSRPPPIPNNPFFNNQNDNDDDVENTQLPLHNDEATTTDIPPEQEAVEEEEKEAMFEKALTPSDVGKLNRLVIPKQHAEKYFPLGGGDSAESRGLLLSFEDESGKCWRFRYSYWNSSQSYVLTKGWSRYVKDKRLDAGDVVLFQRHRVRANRLFIGWRRRQIYSGSAVAHGSKAGTSGDGNCVNDGSKNGNGGVTSGWTRGFYPAHHSYPAHHHHPFAYQADSLHAGGGSQQGQKQTTPVGNSSSSSSRVLRLFGVNMECQPENDSETLSSYNMSSTQGTATYHYYHHNRPSYSSTSNPHHHMVRQQPH